MTGTSSDEPRPEDLEIDLSVRRIGSLELDSHGGDPTVIEPFSGLLGGDSAGSTAPSAMSDSKDLTRPGGPLPELSYLTLRPLVIRTLRERLAATSRSGEGPAESATDATGSGPAATEGSDGSADSGRLTVREFVNRRREDSATDESTASGFDRVVDSATGDARDVDRRRASLEGDHTDSADVSRGLSGPTDDEGAGPTSQGRPEDTARPSRPAPRGEATVDETNSLSAEANLFRERGSDSGPAQPGATPPPSLDVLTGPPSSSDRGRSSTPPTDPAGGSRTDRPTESEQVSRDAPWRNPPRTVVLDRAVTGSGDAGRNRTRSLADADPSDDGGSGSAARGVRPNGDVGKSRSADRSSADRSGTTLEGHELEEEVASSVAKMDGEPFERFVDRLSSELDRKSRVERERRGL